MEDSIVLHAGFHQPHRDRKNPFIDLNMNESHLGDMQPIRMFASAVNTPRYAEVPEVAISRGSDLSGHFNDGFDV